MPRPRLPEWFKIRLPNGERLTRYERVKSRARELDLHTVCEEAKCPNIGECWGGGTATFMVMGDVCTRGCRFCAVNTRRSGAPLDPDEPANIARAIREMELDYVVVTSVDRDDLPDQGAGHFADCIRAIRRESPRALVEVLIPDFRGCEDLVDVVTDAGPEVVAHNVECVERLQATVRDPRAGYRQSLDVLARIKARDPHRLSKSSLMVGVGETGDEMLQAMRDLRSVGVDFLTIGQYLRPSSRHLAIDSFVPPERFAEYEAEGLALGFAYVASGPLVRSSYKAGEYFIRDFIRERGAGRRQQTGE
jgi:lipoic acid synthetase